MDTRVKTILFPTSDIGASKRMFTRLLGVEPVNDSPHYVGFQIEGQDIGLDPGGEERGMTGATPFFEVDDIRRTVDELKAAGADIVEDVRNAGGGKLIAMLSDQDGSMIGVTQTP